MLCILLKKGSQIHCWSGWYWLYLKLLKSSVYTFPTALNHTSPLASPLQLYRLLKLHILQLKLSLYFRQFKGPYNFTKQHIKYWKSRVNTNQENIIEPVAGLWRKLDLHVRQYLCGCTAILLVELMKYKTPQSGFWEQRKCQASQFLLRYGSMWVAIKKATVALFQQPPHTYPETSMQQ